MNQENSGQKDKRKIVVEFEIPEDSLDIDSDYINQVIESLQEADEWLAAELLESAKTVSFSDSRNYDTIP